MLPYAAMLLIFFLLRHAVVDAIAAYAADDSRHYACYTIRRLFRRVTLP